MKKLLSSFARRFDFRFLFVLSVLICFFPAPMRADPASVVVPSTDTGGPWWVQMATAVLVPLILAGVKKVLPSLPSAVIPWIAPFLGILIEFGEHFVTQHPTNVLAGALLGIAGIGVRELKDKVLPAQNGGWPQPG